MPNISIQPATALSFLGLTAVILGILLILGGTGIISPAMIQIVPARKTWMAGIILTLLGIISILPEVLSSPRTIEPDRPTTSPIEVAGRPTHTPSIQQELTKTPLTSQVTSPTIASSEIPSVTIPDTPVPTIVIATPTVDVPAVVLPVPTATLSSKQALCNQLMNTFPQTLADIKSTFNLPDSRKNVFRLVTEVCPNVTNGFIIEDTISEFRLEVPEGGCIDFWSGDTVYEGNETPIDDGFGGWRVFSGSVYTRGVTYRVANCV